MLSPTHARLSGLHTPHSGRYSDPVYVRYIYMVAPVCALSAWVVLKV